MSEAVKKLEPVVVTFSCFKPKQRKLVLQALDSSHLKGISEIALNIVKNSVKLTPEELKTCHRWRKSLKLLALKRFPVKEKRRLLQKGGFFGAFLPIIVSIVRHLRDG